MKSVRTVSIIFGTVLLVSFVGCDRGADGGKFNIVGEWLRTRTLEVGNRTEVDTWRITFHDDGTFNELHMETDDLDNDPFVPLESRQGTWDLDKDGNLTLTGQWLDMTGGEVNSLSELGENLYGYSRQVMSIKAPGGDMIFIGPDVLTFTTWPYSQSYMVLYSDPDNNSLARSFNVQLTDGEGAVIESRVESYTFQVGASGCTGQFAKTEILNETDESFSGDFTSCEYSVTAAVEVEDVDGSIVQVQAVVFTYEAEGLTSGQPEQEFYIQIGDHYLGYNPSEQAKAIRNSAFVRVQ